jgi:hypothetical protein
MISLATWKYLPLRDVKHYFTTPDRTMALCGHQSAQYNWRNDEGGLKKRTECRMCLRMLKGPK